MTDNNDDVKIKVVKTIVLIFTLLIIIAASFLVYIVANKKKFKDTKIPAIEIGIPPNISLEQPKGSQIAEFKAQGGYIYIKVTGGMKPERIIMVDINSGKVISSIFLGSNE